MSKIQQWIVFIFALTCSLAANTSAAPIKSEDPTIESSVKQSKYGAGLEPYLGYQGFGPFTEQQINASYSTVNGSYFGGLLGARVYFEFNRLVFAGMDFNYLPSMGYLSTLGKSPTTNSTDKKSQCVRRYCEFKDLPRISLACDQDGRGFRSQGV